jgi:hypothetical protein
MGGSTESIDCFLSWIGACRMETSGRATSSSPSGPTHFCSKSCPILSVYVGPQTKQLTDLKVMSVYVGSSLSSPTEIRALSWRRPNQSRHVKSRWLPTLTETPYPISASHARANAFSHEGVSFPPSAPLYKGDGGSARAEHNHGRPPRYLGEDRGDGPRLVCGRWARLAGPCAVHIRRGGNRCVQSHPRRRWQGAG